MAKYPTALQVESAKSILKQAGYFVESLWCEEDIIWRAKDTGQQRITKKQAQEIMHLMGKRHDANCGVNWDFIDSVTEEYFAK